jgi:hypothetical protein
MRIANPIYDTVFKYLMDDEPLARLLLSTILDEEVVEVALKPQERTTEIGARFLTIYRLDFAATIKNAAGERRQVLIEIQKAKLASDIMRFRRYLGEQYRDPANVHEVAGVSGDRVRIALPILTIYFLGHALDHTRAPVIRVRRESTDVTTGERLAKKEPFIESLTHDSYVIQIPHLRTEHQTEIEQLLQIFDQRLVVAEDRHVLEIDESEVPARYRPFLQRLQRAMAEPEVAEAMAVEDEVLLDLQDLERRIEHERAEKERERAEKERERAERLAAETRAGQAADLAERERTERLAAETRAGQAADLAERERAEKERLLERLRQAGLEP